MESYISQQYTTKPYRDARIAYVTYAALGYLIELLTDDAFLAQLLLRLGVSESRIGVISSFISLAFLMQIFSLPLLRMRISFKRSSILFTIGGLALFGVVFLLPLIPVMNTAVRLFGVSLILLAHCSRYFISGVQQRWTNAYVDPYKRGSFSATKESISLVIGIIFSLLTGFAFDRFQNAGKTDTAFTLFGIAIFVISAGCFFCLEKIPAGNFSDSTGRPLKETLHCMFGSKPFRRVLILTALWEAGRFFTMGFIGTFKTETLGMTMLTVEIINTVSCVCRLIATPLFGKYTDKYSFVSSIELGLIIALASFLCIVYTTKEMWFLVIGYTVLFQVCQAGVNQNFLNISYAYVDERFLTEALAIRASIGGVCGFLSSSVAALVFEAVAHSGWAGVAPQQILAVVSSFMMVVTLAYAHFVVKPMPIKKQ